MFGRTEAPHFSGTRTQVSQTFRLWDLSRLLVRMRKSSQNRLVKLVCTTVTIDSFPCQAWMHFLFLIVDVTELNFHFDPVCRPHKFSEQSPTFVNLALK